jgi:hypothetical protein
MSNFLGCTLPHISYNDEIAEHVSTSEMRNEYNLQPVKLKRRNHIGVLRATQKVTFKWILNDKCEEVESIRLSLYRV